MSDGRGFDFLKSDAFIIAFGTLVLYSAAYIFWFGFIDFFYIPFQFVDLGLNGIIVGGGLFVGYMLVFLFISLVLYSFLFPMNFFKSLVASVKQTREKQVRAIAESKLPTTVRFLELLMLILSVLLFSGLVSYGLGKFSAWTARDFLVTATAPEMVVLYKSGDNLICAPFDRKEKKVYRRFTILRLDKESVPVLSLQKVGPLSVVE